MTKSVEWLLMAGVGLLLSCTNQVDGTAPSCPGPDEDCACGNEGVQVPCYMDPEFAGGEMLCHVGVRSCEAGRWSACEDVQTDVRRMTSALIEGPAECNPCNPNCQINRDRPNDGDLTPDNSSDVAFDPSTGGLRPTPNDTTTVTGGTGPTNGDPFDLTEGEAEGLTLAPDGALILDSSAFDPDFIWIANTGDGTISKFNIFTGDEEGRYYPGPSGSGNDPSRTSVNTSGDAFVAGRDGVFISRISASGFRGGCPDTDGDGVVTTSQDLNGDGVINTNLAAGEMFAFGSDDCLLWHRNLRGIMPGGKIRAVAAQDIVDPVGGTVDEFVWVGGYNDARIAQLDGDGNILMWTSVPTRPYGFALDRDQNLWISAISSTIGRVDTTRCNGAVGCPGSFCSGDTAACEAAIKQTIPIPRRSYGITVDFNQRIWLGGEGDAMVYDRSRPFGTRARNLGTGGAGGWRAGITADSQGNVWTTGSGGVWRIDGNNTANRLFIARTAASTYARGWGAAVDSQNQAWIINRWENRAHVFVPAGGPSFGLGAYAVRVEATSVRSPYTYSDMTGSQLRLAAANRGTYFATLEGCDTGVPQWEALNYDVVTPPDTFVIYRVRVANTLVDLAGATWVPITIIPGGPASPSPVRPTMLLAGESPLGRFAQIEVSLVSVAGDPTMLITPRVYGFGLTHTCIELTTGTYSRMYDATENCEIPGRDRPVWGSFDYFSIVPAGTSIAFEVRTGDTAAAASAGAAAIWNVPPNPENGSFDIGTLLAGSGLPTNSPFLEVTALMNSSVTDRPTLIGFDTQYDCVPME